MSERRERPVPVRPRPGGAPLRGVSFDATGTLFACPRRGEIYAEVLARHSSHPDGARGFWRELLERSCALLGRQAPGPFAAAELFARFEHADAWELRPGAREVLAELRRRGLRVAVTSNWDRRLLRVLTNLGLGGDIDAVICSEDVGSAKPAETIFLAACRALELAPASVLHVGDGKIEDREGAVAAGLSALWLNAAEGDIRALEEVLDYVPG